MLDFNSKERLLACIDKTSNSNLVFYYYNSTQNSILTEKIVSLKGKREWNTKSTITLKRSNNQEITLKDISVDHSSLWFWSSWLNRELKLESICQNNSVPLEHNSGKRPLTCQWTLKEHGGQNRSGREVWQPFNFHPDSLTK